MAWNKRFELSVWQHYTNVINVTQRWKCFRISRKELRDEEMAAMRRNVVEIVISSMQGWSQCCHFNQNDFDFSNHSKIIPRSLIVAALTETSLNTQNPALSHRLANLISNQRSSLMTRHQISSRAYNCSSKASALHFSSSILRLVVSKCNHNAVDISFVFMPLTAVFLLSLSASAFISLCYFSYCFRAAHAFLLMPFFV